jgi:hypothetical protein
MRISKTKVLDFLMRCQIERGGYTGNDIAKLAKNTPVSPRALRKRINYWTSTDPAFRQLTYQGQRTIPITLDDFVLINQRLKEKPLGRMSDILQEKLTDNFSECEIIHHHATAQVLLDLCRGERKWAFLTEEERKKLTKNRLIQNLRELEQCLKAVLTKKLISYIRKGKLTLAHSFKYQDIGKVIESVELSDGDWMITQEDIEKLI